MVQCGFRFLPDRVVALLWWMNGKSKPPGSEHGTDMKHIRWERLFLASLLPSSHSPAIPSFIPDSTQITRTKNSSSTLVSAVPASLLFTTSDYDYQVAQTATRQSQSNQEKGKNTVVLEGEPSPIRIGRKRICCGNTLDSLRLVCWWFRFGGWICCRNFINSDLENGVL